MPIFRVKSVKIYTGQKNLHWRRQTRQRQLSGMVRSLHCLVCPSVPNLTDVTLVFKNVNWKTVDAATVVNVAIDEERIIDSLVEKLKFG